MTADNPLIADRVDTTTDWTGLGLAEDVEQLIGAFNSGSWIDGVIGGFAASMDVLAAALDPLGQLVSWGVSWLIEHVKPLSDALDWLAGDPDQITAYASTWTNVSTTMQRASDDFDAAIRADLAAWQQAAAEAYRAHAGEQRQAMSTMALGATAMAAITTGTGLVVALVREIVRDLIADFVSVLAVRIWEWLAIAGGTLGAGAPWVAAQVSSLVAKWAAKVARLLVGLVGSLRRLAPMLRRLDGIFDQLRDLLARLARREPTTPKVQSPLFSRQGGITNRQVVDEELGLPRTRETVEHYARLAGVDVDRLNLQIIESPDDVGYLDFMGASARTDNHGVQLGPAAFVDEETLIRTIGHESIHVEQYAQGRISTQTGPLEDEAYASEDGFVANWRRNKQ